VNDFVVSNMRMDIADFPIVKMDYSAPYRVDFREILDGLDELFAKEQPFVIIGEGESSQEETDQAKDVRMEVTAWANQRKALLNRWVLSSFMVIPDPKKREEMRLYALINADNSLSIPGHTVFDLGARYTSKVAGNPITVRAAVTNVDNKAYWSKANFTNLGMGAPRTFNLSVTMDF
jgi:outer membrane receptor for ferrienterochelin and colicin